MKKIAILACTAALLSGPALAQSPASGTAQPQAPATTAKPATTTNATSPTTGAGTPASTTGIQSAAPAGSVKLSFYTVQPADMRASKLMGAEVYNLKNENVGEIEDLIIDNGKNIRGVVVSVGGFLGIGDRHISVQPGSLTATEQKDGGIRVVINTSKDELKNAPQVKMEDLDKSAANDETGSTSDNTASTNTPPRSSSK